jgi:hypothetical protein
VSDGPSDEAPDEQPRIQRQSDNGTPSSPMQAQSEPQTTIIRRHPTGELPALAEPPTSYIPPEGQGDYIPRARPVTVGTPRSAWATAVIATDLITGWWRSDQLFCVAIGFLTAVSAAALISGLIALLLRRRMGRLLIVVGAIVALLIFAGLFVAGAKLPPVVYAIPVLPVASVLLALLPATRRWARSGSG